MSIRFKIFLTLTLMLTVALSSSVTTMLVLGRAASAVELPATAVIENPTRHAAVDNVLSHMSIDSSGNVTISGATVSVKAQSAASMTGGTTATVTGTAVTTIKGGLVKIN